MSKLINNKVEVLDIVRSNSLIRKLIKQKISDGDYSYDELISAANKKRIVLTKAAISRYLNSEDHIKGIPTQEAILFLCKFLNIKIDVNVSTMDH